MHTTCEYADFLDGVVKAWHDWPKWAKQANAISMGYIANLRMFGNRINEVDRIILIGSWTE